MCWGVREVSWEIRTNWGLRRGLDDAGGESWAGAVEVFGGFADVLIGGGVSVLPVRAYLSGFGGDSFLLLGFQEVHESQPTFRSFWPTPQAVMGVGEGGVKGFLLSL
jgi:hypothetical protein